MQTTEITASIRAQLKTMGIKASAVSVRASHGSIHITINSARVKIATVKAIALPFQRVARCEASGEILSGGNRFVFVEYSRTAPEIVAIRDMVAASEQAGTAITAADGTTYQVSSGGADHFNPQWWSTPSASDAHGSRIGGSHMVPEYLIAADPLAV